MNNNSTSSCLSSDKVNEPISRAGGKEITILQKLGRNMQFLKLHVGVPKLSLVPSSPGFDQKTRGLGAGMVM